MTNATEDVREKNYQEYFIEAEQEKVDTSEIGNVNISVYVRSSFRILKLYKVMFLQIKEL